MIQEYFKSVYDSVAAGIPIDIAGWGDYSALVFARCAGPLKQQFSNCFERSASLVFDVKAPRLRTQFAAFRPLTKSTLGSGMT